MTASNDDDRIARAGEYALRVLSPAEEAAARAEAARDPVFGAEVDRWNDQLSHMADGIAPVQPSASLWPRILAATGGAANDNAVTFWRRWAIGSTGLLAASLAAVAIMIATPAPAPDPATTPVAGSITRVATLKLDNGVTALTLAYDSATGELYLAPTREMEGDTRIPHLWLVLPNEGGVQLVGAIDGHDTSRHNLEGVIVGQATEAIAVAVSMEEPGHTPNPDRPDGPVVAEGEFQPL
ncbi:anti-sigma factor domain-containing protein [Brevundimonas halotolerans]|jgi:anti-sigma-K factor RskA|uniref:Anti-sigma-K factor RskA n=1 Tax=Brevundimonas halotolerans TaxID=69670 RepID=A0A7W9A2F5_9CAUL|nr:anti-sigma factor [Brevundimonas halotolerans]MBB5659880.1 anti-sigma-K factor RskA [Brevundimonas halotolerans]